eukprot:157536-Pelagomonas_calceolata.AAC.6
MAPLYAIPKLTSELRTALALPAVCITPTLITKEGGGCPHNILLGLVVPGASPEAAPAAPAATGWRHGFSWAQAAAVAPHDAGLLTDGRADAAGPFDGRQVCTHARMQGRTSTFVHFMRMRTDSMHTTTHTSCKAGPARTCRARSAQT